MVLGLFIIIQTIILSKHVTFNPKVDKNIITSLIAQNLSIKTQNIIIKSLDIKYFQTYKERMYYVGQISGPRLIENKGSLFNSFYQYSTSLNDCENLNLRKPQVYTFKMVSNFSTEDIISTSIKYLPISTGNFKNIFISKLIPEIIFFIISLEVLYFHLLCPSYQRTVIDYYFIINSAFLLFFMGSLFYMQTLQNYVILLFLFFLIFQNNMFVFSIAFFIFTSKDILLNSLFILFIFNNQKFQIIILLSINFIAYFNYEFWFSYLLLLHYFTKINSITNTSIDINDNNQSILVQKNSIDSRMKNDKGYQFFNIFPYISIIYIIIFLLNFAVYNNHYYHYNYSDTSMYNLDNVDISLNMWYPENNTMYYPELIKDMLKEAQKDSLIDAECPLCCFKPINKSTSTTRDLIIIQAGGIVNESLLSIRTLRTTGCKAKIFLILFPSDNLSRYEKNLFEKCGISIFYIEKSNEYRISNRVNNIMATMRFIINEEFGYEGYKYIDRIFYFDTKDTVFQEDPFNYITEPNTLYVSPEFHKIKRNSAMRYWINMIPNFKHYVLSQYEVICNGIFGSDIPTISKLGQLIKALHINKDFIAVDQAQYDYLIYLKILERSGINISINKKYASIAVTKNDYIPSILGKFRHKNGDIPAVIHQYNRLDILTNNFYSSCPKTKCEIINQE